MDDGQAQNIVVITLPYHPEDIRAERDYYVECLYSGVVVLGKGTELRVERLPELSSVVVRPAYMEEAGDYVTLEQPEVLRGHSVEQMAPEGGSTEKQAILARLKAYRREKGLGCLDEVADLCRCKARIDATVLRDVLLGGAALGIEDWRRIGRALDKLGPAGDGGGAG